MQLSDYAQALSAAQQLVPSFQDQEQQAAQTRVLQMQPQLIQQQINASKQDAQLKAQSAAYQDQRRTAFTGVLAKLGANPTPDMLYNAGVQFPEFAQTINQAAKGIAESKRVATVRQLAPIQAYIQNGKYDQAAAEVKRHIDADVAAGNQPDETDQELYTELTSGDPTRQKAAGGVVYGLISAVNPDTAAANIQKRQDSNTHVVSQGGALVGDDGTVLFQSDSKPEYRTVKNADGTESIVQVSGSEGGGQASSGGAASGGAAYARSNIRGAESAGNDGATNSHGTAAGRYQITAPTALRLMVQNPAAFPEVTGKSAAERRAFATRADVQERMMDILEPQYRAALGGINAPANGTNMYMMHFLGTGTGAKFLQATQGNPAADAQTMIRSIDPKNADKIISGNGAIFAKGQTAGGVVQEIGRRYAGANGGGSGGDGFSRPAPGGGQASSGGSGSRVVYTSGSGTSSDNPDAVGPSFLATLSPGRRNLLQAINEGRQPAPKPGSRFGQQLSEDLARAYPDQDATTFAAKQQTRKDFTGSGKAATALSSYNRFAAHLNSAWAIHQRLGGPNLGPLSGFAAGVAQSFSPKDVNAYNTEIDGIQGEFQKLTKLGVANEGEANRLIHAARAAQSAEGRAGALEAMASLVAGAYQPQVAQWRSAFPDKPLPVDVSPSSKAVINNVIHGGKAALPMGSNGAPVGNARGFGAGGSGFRIVGRRSK